MQTQPEGTPPQAELGQLTPQQSAELAQQAAAPAPGAPPAGTPGVPPSPDLAALQAELARAQEAKTAAEALAQQNEKRFRDTQAAFTQSQQQLQALAGTLPKQNPLAPYVEKIKAELPDLDDRAAAFFAKQNYDNDQRIAQLQTSFTARDSVDGIVGAVLNSPQGAALRENPNAINAMRNALTHAAHNGDMQSLNPDFALRVGAQEFYLSQFANPQTPPGTPPAPPPQAPPVNFPAQWTPVANGFPKPTAPNVQPQLTPQQQAWNNDLQTFFPKK